MNLEKIIAGIFPTKMTLSEAQEKVRASFLEINGYPLELSNKELEKKIVSYVVNNIIKPVEEEKNNFLENTDGFSVEDAIYVIRRTIKKW